MVKVTNFSNSDLIESVFNNYNLRAKFGEYDVQHAFIVDKKLSQNDNVMQLYGNRWSYKVKKINSILNYYTGYQNRLNFWSGARAEKLLLSSKNDLVHFQLVENGWFYLPTIFKISAELPSVWTWHDLWPITGHCIQPNGCMEWAGGCQNCPDLKRPFAVKIDVTNKQMQYKIDKLIQYPINIHVTTTWMYDQIKNFDPKISRNIKIIPFGISVPKNLLEKQTLRSKYNLGENDKILFIRGTSGHYKTILPVVNYFKSNPKLASKLILIDVDSNGYFSEIPFKKILKFPWLERVNMLELLSISDLLILPSSAESFGVLIVESQLLGVPVLVQENSACAEVAGNPSTAYYFTAANLSKKFEEVISKVLNCHEELISISINAKKWAEFQYDEDKYVREMSQYYQQVISNFNEYRT